MGAASGKNASALTIQHYGGSQGPVTLGKDAGASPNDNSLAEDDNIDFTEDVSIEEKEKETPIRECCEELENFLKYHEANPLKVKVGVSRTERSFFKGKTTFFKVEFSGERQCTCDRKYEEFVVLSKILRKRFEGVSVPPFRRKGFGDEDGVIRKRIKGLEVFLQAVVRHPFLRFDSAFEDFMSTSDPFTKKRADALPTDNSKGVQNWKRMLRVSKTPSTPIKALKSLNAEILVLRNFYKTLKVALKAYIDKLLIYAVAVSELGSSFDSWKKIEGSKVPLLSGVASISNTLGDEENLPLSNMIVQVEEKYTASAKKITSQVEDIVKIIKGPLTFEIMALDSLRDELQIIKQVVATQKKAFKKCEEAKLQNYKATQPTFNGKEGNVTAKTSTKTENKLAEAQKVKREALKQAHIYLRGLLIIERQRFRHERATRGAEILKNLTEMNLNLAQDANKAWKDAFESISTHITPRSDLSLMASIKETLKVSDSNPVKSVPVNDFEKPLDDDDDDDPEFDDEECPVSVPSQNSRPGLVKKAQSVRAIQDFKSEQEGERDLVEGETLEGEYAEESPEWFWVTTEGREGYVPASHIELVEEANDQEDDLSNGFPEELYEKKDAESEPAASIPTIPVVPKDTKPVQSMDVSKAAESEDTQDPARPADFLSSIQSFKKTELKQQSNIL